MNTYQCFYRGRVIEVKAETSFKAQRIAADEFRCAKKPWNVSVIIVQNEHGPVVHKPQDITP